MQTHVVDAAQALTRQFQESSTRWPNLTSVLVLWPQDEPEPNIPDDLSAPPAIPVSGPAENSLAWDGMYCDRCDTPQRRYRTGYAGQLSYWRRFGKFFDRNEIADPDAEMACDQRFRALAEAASRLIDDLDGAALSADTLGWGTTDKWPAVSNTRWQLAVHEVTTPVRYKIDGTPAVYERISDLWLASATAVVQLVTAVLSPADARNKFCYEQCCAHVPYFNIERALKKHSEWEPLTGANSIKAAAGRYAAKFDKPPIPKRQHGRRPGKAK